MQRVLQQFISESLFDATSAFLAKLGIQFDRETAEPINVAELYDQTMPKYLTEALAKIDKTYFIGVVNDQSLQGSKTDESLQDITGNIRHGGKYDGMFVFACDAKRCANLTRTDASSLTRAFNRIASANPVILVIRQNECLSLSTCERMEYTQLWRQGGSEKIGKVCMLRNVNCKKPHRGHIDILESLGEKSFSTFEDLYKHWMEVFSSELLTKKFYKELSDWFAWAVQIVRFPNDLETNEDDTKFNLESCIRLITRLIFVWFLKQKHLIPDEFFDEDYIRKHFIDNFNPRQEETCYYNPNQSKYYRLIVQNLFFAMLNCPIVAEGKDTPNNRRFRSDGQKGFLREGYNVNNLMRYKNEFKQGGAEEFVRVANSHVPFLNGGLFECLDDKPNKMYLDGFSERKKSLEQLYLPDWLFFGDEAGKNIDLSQWYDDKKSSKVTVRGLIEILKRYNFTIEENTPLDQEVSLDPELLGKVFENLLASYNPETKTSARKQTGSFYTPREIVQYMVDESLVAHLKRICGNALEAEYRKLVSYSTEETTLTEVQRKNVMRAIYDCKVLDPACGSGAFPMGVLQQMVHILRQLDPTNEMWKDFIMDLAIEQSRDAITENDEEERKTRMSDIEEAFNRHVNDPDYARKLYLIEHCIYGVDIQPIAVQISKLRFFISLVVDQKPTNDATHNFGIRPLPNLESKFVAANTLIPVKYDGSLVESNPDVRKSKDKLKKLNHQVFLAKSNAKKERLKDDIRTTRKQLAKAIEDTGFAGHSEAELLAGWDMFDQNASSSYFDAEWMFGVTDGFDIIIGNPPYVQLQNNGGELAKLYEHCKYATFARTGDIYCLFYEGGWKMLKKNGHLCFITSNKWMRAGYGENTRDFFANKTNPMLLIDFAGVKIFESATVDTNILLFSKSNNRHETICAVTNKQNKDGVKNLSDFVQQQNTVCGFSSSDSWVILSPIEQSIKRKIEAVGTPLKDWDIQINYGIKTGYNDAFIISAEKRNEILANCKTEDERQRTAELIRPILRGRDIKRYGYVDNGLYLINTHNGIRGRIPRIKIEDYPAVKEHLDQFWDKISKRSDKGDTPYNLRNCAYLEDFYKPKIIYQELSQGSSFAIDENGLYIPSNTAYLITGKHLDYLLKMLNSKIVEYAYKTYYATMLGSTGLRWLSQHINQLPIPIYKNTFEQNDIKDGNVDDIDSRIANLYGLSIDEWNFIVAQYN